MKKILLSILMLYALAVNAADAVWCMVTNTGTVIPMSNVSYIIAEGAAPETFSIVLKSGSPIEGVGKASFSQQDATGITNVIENGGTPVLTRAFGDQLTISGAEEDLRIDIYSINGKLLKRDRTSNSQTTIYIGDLTPGLYVLRVGGSSLKFTKK